MRAKKKFYPTANVVASPEADISSYHEVGGFPRFIGEAPPEEYQYDPGQSYNPEDFPPAPPGYGEKGSPAISLEEYKQEQDAVPLPQNPDGSTSYPQQIGPEPPIFYATNVPETAQKWGKQGQNYTFLAESPQAMQTAKEIGAPKVMRGYRDEDQQPASPFGPSKSAVGPEPKAGELDEMNKFKGFWKTHVDEHYKGQDPLTVNPSEEGVKAEEEARRKYALGLLNREPGSIDYKNYEKLIAEAKKDAVTKAEWQRKIGEEDHKNSQQFFKQAYDDHLKSIPKPASGSEIQAAQQYTQRALFGPDSWQNKILTQEEKDLVAKGTKPVIPEGRQFDPRILNDVNRRRVASGLPPIVEKQGPSKRFRNTRTFLGAEITSPEYTTEPGGFNYAEGQGQAQAPRPAAAPAQQGGSAQVVRTGMHNGRRVIQYSDGRVVYAPN